MALRIKFRTLVKAEILWQSTFDCLECARAFRGHLEITHSLLTFD